jgi:hypothetical protein
MGELLQRQVLERSKSSEIKREMSGGVTEDSRNDAQKDLLWTVECVPARYSDQRLVAGSPVVHHHHQASSPWPTSQRRRGTA